MSNFGERVVGKKAHDDAVVKTQTGAATFGSRVVDGIPGSGNSAFGTRVLIDSPTSGGSRAKGSSKSDKSGEFLSTEEIERVLDENPTFFDSLYRAELERPGGARKKALEIFDIVEMGPKGAGRIQIHETINRLLGRVDDTQQVQEGRAEAEKVQIGEQAERMQENKLLQDAPRLKALREREENLAFVQGKGGKGARSQIDRTSDDTDSQIKAIASRTRGARSKTSKAKGGSGRNAARKTPSRSGKAAKRKPAGQKSASYQAPVASGSDAKQS